MNQAQGTGSQLGAGVQRPVLPPHGTSLLWETGEERGARCCANAGDVIPRTHPKAFPKNMPGAGCSHARADGAAVRVSWGTPRPLPCSPPAPR